MLQYLTRVVRLSFCFMNPAKYIAETIGELKLVHWPTRNTTVKLTIMVIVVSAVVALYVGGLDYLFTNLLKLIIK